MSSRPSSAWSVRRSATWSCARRELPRTAPVTKALEAVNDAATRLSAARDRLKEARTTLDGRTAELDARTRRLRRAAADRDMPADPEEVSLVEGGVAEFERAAEELVRARGNAS